MRHAIMLVAALCCSTAVAARQRAVQPTAPSIGERVDAIAPGQELTFATAEYDASTARIAIDVRYGPADRIHDGASTWLADGVGRDGAMRIAGIDRLTVVRSASTVRVVAVAKTLGTALAAR